MAYDASPASHETTPESVVGEWLAELSRAEKEMESWQSSVDKIQKRYRGEHKGLSEKVPPNLNILWSNIETLKRAVYARRPKPIVSRRYKDKDPVGRYASQILERALDYIVGLGPFHAAMRYSTFDWLIGARGTVWVRKDVKTKTVPVIDPATNQPMMDGEEVVEQEEVVREDICFDWIHRKDFLVSPARIWEEVRWVARRSYMSRKQVEKRWPDLPAETLDQIAFDLGPDGEKENAEPTKTSYAPLMRAALWEIWCKDTMEVHWICKGLDDPIETKPDPLGLEDFWPCPKPMYGTLVTEDLVPTPDFDLYRTQADEIDELSVRIDRLVAAIKVIGVYDQSNGAIQGIFTTAREPSLVPVDNWMSFVERGGMRGAIEFLPIDMFVATLQQLYASRDVVKEEVYEITGISDIIRGASDANETATAQRIKGKFGTMRLQERQEEVARFARDLINIAGELVCEHFLPESIKQMSSAEEIEGAMTTPPAPPPPPEAPPPMGHNGGPEMGPEIGPEIGPEMGPEMPPGPPPGPPPPPPEPVFDEEKFAAAIALLKDEKTRGFRTEIETDSTIEPDEAEEKQARVEFLQAMGQFMGPALEAAKANPELGPLIGKMMLFAVRGFKAGRDLEEEFEATIERLSAAGSAPPPPDPAAEAEAKKAAVEEQRFAMDKEERDRRFGLDAERQQADIGKMSAEEQRLGEQHAAGMASQHFDRQHREREFGLQEQQFADGQTARREQLQADGMLFQDDGSMVAQETLREQEGTAALEQVSQALAVQGVALGELAAALKAPKRIVSDDNGRPIGVESETPAAA